MELFQIDHLGQLFISPDVDDWKPLEERGIDAVFDLDDDLDIGIPNVPNQILYIYFPFEDTCALPNKERLHDLAKLAAKLILNGQKVLSHCGMGHNRSALLAGITLTYLGLDGKAAVALIRQKRPGALYNKVFADYVESLVCAPAQATVPNVAPVALATPLGPNTAEQTAAAVAAKVLGADKTDQPQA